MHFFISENLTWSDHISVLISKVSMNLGVVCKNLVVVHCIAQMMLDHVLYSLYVTPYLSYCNIVWATKVTTQITKLFILQKKAIRIITHSRWNSHTSLLFRNKYILKLNDLNTFLVGCFMHSAMHTELPAVLNDWFITNSSIHTYNTR